MKALLAFIGGAVTGAAVAALYAPARGAVLRRRIRQILHSKGVARKEEIDDLVEMIAAEIEE